MNDISRRQLGGLGALDRMKGIGQPLPPTPSPAPVVIAVPGQAPLVTRAVEANQSAEQRVEPVSTSQAIKSAPAPTPRRTRVSEPVRGPVPLAEGSPVDKMTTYIARPTRERAKAAFRATGHLEGDGSFSEFIADAIVRELERREKLYNDGQPYAGGGGRLTAGRPLS
jgi:hypothetical protein